MWLDVDDLADGLFSIGTSKHKLKDFQNEKTLKAYSKVGTDLVTFCLGVIEGEITEFKTSFTPEMAAKGKTLLTALHSISTADQDRAMQSFLFSIFSQKRCGEANKYSFLAYAFLVPYSYTEHGHLQPCNIFSQYFSKTVFTGRLTIFNKITADAIRENKGYFE